MKYINFVGGVGSVETDINKWLMEDDPTIILQSHVVTIAEDGSKTLIVGIFYKTK